jgi:hypothetical protein
MVIAWLLVIACASPRGERNDLQGATTRARDGRED